MKTTECLLALTAFVVLTAACAPAAGVNTRSAAAPPAASGIDVAGIDPSVAPGDDFFRYANGTWIKNTEIPADRSR
jgi:hypothetical protein